MAGANLPSVRAGIPYIVRNDYSPDFKDGLKLVEGDIVEIFSTEESTEWWTGVSDGQRGYVLPSVIEPLSGPCEPLSSLHTITNPLNPVEPCLQEAIFELPVMIISEIEATNTLASVSASFPSPPTTPRLSPRTSAKDDVKLPNTPTDLDAGGYRLAPTLVRALYDTEAFNEGDLSYKRGDIIEVEVRSTAEVWQGRIGDKTGDFRLDYTVEPLLTDRVRALFDYKPDTPEDLVLKGGDIIQVIGRSNQSNWWLYGLVEGQGIGLFPFNFIEPLKHDFEDEDDEETPNIVSNSPSKNATRIRVLHDVKGIEEGMLSLKRGDVLELVERKTPDRWVGRLKSQTGWFNLDNSVEPIMTDRVKAIHSYSPKDLEELQFSANDVIDVVGPTDDSTWWWYGTVHGRFGMFPFNFVETIPDQKRADTDPNDSIEVPMDEIPKTMRALYSFHSKDPLDLSFEEGNIIKVLESTDPEWWEGELNGRTGMFPRSYCEPIIQTPENENLPDATTPILSTSNDTFNTTAPPTLSIAIPMSTSPQPKDSPVVRVVRAIRDSQLSSDPEELNFRAGETIEVVDMPKTTMWWRGRLKGKTGIFPSDFVEDISEPVPIPVVPALSPITESSEANLPSSATTETTPDNLPWDPCFARALYDFTGEPGELTFLRGDVIEITNMYHADWWHGKLREEIGNVPTNYVELIVIPSASRTPTLAISSSASTFSVLDDRSPKPKLSGLILPLTEEPSTISEEEESHESQQTSTYPVGVERVRAVHPWDSGKPRELIIEAGDVIRVLTRPMEHWWRGVLEKNYSVGLFPAKIVEAVPDESPRISWSIVSRKQRDEAAVALRSNLVKLRPLLENFDCTSQDLADDAQIQKLFKDSCVLKRKLVRSLSEHATSNDDILSLEISFEEIRTMYDRLLAASAAQHWEKVDSHGFMNAPRRLTDLNKGSLTVTSPVGKAFNFKSNTIGPISMEASASTSAPLSFGPQRRNTGGSIRNTQLPPTPSPVLRPARDSFQKYEGRLSGIALEIERAREAYSSSKSIGRSNSTRHLPVSPAAILSILRPGKTTRPSSGESTLKKTIYKPSVEYQYVHVVHANQTAPKRTR